jgi:hypothetical protein
MERVVVLRDKYAGIIFPRNTTIEDKRTVWEPTPEDVERAERRIAEYLRPKPPERGTRLGEYVRQYFGAATNGHRVILCRFVHRSERATAVPVQGVDSYLRTIGTPYPPADEVERFFQLLYDPGTDACRSIPANTRW